MRKAIFYSSIVILYLLTPFCIMAMLGKMVTKKYEVDEIYWMVDSNNKLTAEQRQKRINELEVKKRKLEFDTFLFGAMAFTTLVAATGLLIKRKSVLAVQKSST